MLQQFGLNSMKKKLLQQVLIHGLLSEDEVWYALRPTTNYFLIHNLRISDLDGIELEKVAQQVTDICHICFPP